MEWIFAGTASGFPEPGTCCSTNFLKAGERTYIIDGGGPVSPLLIRCGIPHDSVKGVFVSHAHSDHRTGLLEFLNQLVWYYSRRSDKVNPTVCLPRQEEIDLFLRYIRASVRGIADWREYVLSEKMKFVHYGEGVIFDDGVLRVTARPNEHNIPESYSFFIEAEGKKILYTGDLGYGFPEYERILNGEAYDLVICEASHHDPGTVNAKLLKTNTKIMRLTHIHPDRVAALTQFVHEAPFDCAFACEGMTLSL